MRFKKILFVVKFQHDIQKLENNQLKKEKNHR